MNPGLLDRLKLTGERIAQIAEGLRRLRLFRIASVRPWNISNVPTELKIDKVRVPLGVIGIIYEARPNVTADAFGLCFKTGNAVILKGGSEPFIPISLLSKYYRMHWKPAVCPGLPYS